MTVVQEREQGAEAIYTMLLCGLRCCSVHLSEARHIWRPSLAQSSATETQTLVLFVLNSEMFKFSTDDRLIILNVPVPSIFIDSLTGNR